MKLKLTVSLNEPQQLFYDDDETKFLNLSGGFGSGKSYVSVLKALKLSQQNKNFPGGFLCPSFPEYKRDIYPAITELLEENLIPFDYHKTDHIFRFPWTKGKMYVFSAEKKIRGPNLAYMVINELTLIPLVRYREAIGRVRIKNAPNPQIASVFTPEGLASDYYEIFEEKPWNGSRVIYADTRQNKENLGDDYITTLESAYDSIMLDAYMKGLWVNMNGNRWYYGYDPVRNDDRTIIEDKENPVLVTLDFNVEPMTCAVWQPWKGGVGAFDEIILNGADTKMMARALKARGYTPERTTIYPDPAGLARSTKGLPDIIQLKNEGFHDIKVKSKAPPMRKRQLNVNNLFEKSILLINPDKCPKLKKDCLAVERDPVTGEKSKKNKALTHLSDGMDYMCDINYPYSGHKPASRVTKYR